MASFANLLDIAHVAFSFTGKTALVTVPVETLASVTIILIIFIYVTRVQRSPYCSAQLLLLDLITQIFRTDGQRKDGFALVDDRQ